MVYIYKVSGKQQKQNGINKQRPVYYRTVYFKTNTGKDGKKDLRCNLLGKIYAKSDMWNIDKHAVSSDVEDEKMEEENKKLATKKVNEARKEKRSEKFMNTQKRKRAADKEEASQNKIAEKYKEVGKNSKGRNADNFWNMHKYTEPEAEDSLNVNSHDVLYGKPPPIFKEDLDIFDKKNGLLEDTCLDAYVKVLRKKAKQVMIYDSKFFFAVQIALSDNTDPFNKDLAANLKKYKNLYFPLHIEPSHWILGAIDTEAHILNMYDSSHYKDYGAYTKPIIALLKKLTNSKFTVKYHNEVPKQTNIYDCGMFVLKNMECLLFKNGKFDYTQSDLAKERKRYKNAILTNINTKPMTRARFNKIANLRTQRHELLRLRNENENGQLL